MPVTTDVADTSGLLTPPPGDLSVTLFDKIFGSGWQHMLTGVGSTSALSEVLATLNIITLSALTIMLLYMAAIGIVGTAHDGQPLGKRYHSSWVPIRAGTSVAFLTPLPWAGGFSLLQAVILLVIYFGMGLASSLWSTVVNWSADHSGQITSVQIRPADARTAAALLKSMVSEKYIRVADDREGVDQWNWTWIPDPASKSESADPLAALGSGGSDETVTTSGRWRLRIPPPRGVPLGPEDLGFVEFRCSSKASIGCQAKAAATNNLISALQPVAAKIVSRYLGRGHERRPVRAEDVLTPLRRFFEIVDLNAAAIRDELNARRAGEIREAARSAADRGWLSAGSWYWTLARRQEEFQEIVAERPSATGPDLKRVARIGAIDGDELTAVVNSVDVILRDAGVNPEGSADPLAAALAGHARGGDDGIVDRMLRAMSDQITPLLRSGIASLSGGDPILKLAALGSSMEAAAMEIFGTYTAARAAAALLPPTRAVALQAGDVVMPIFYGLLVAGLALSLYVPAIPLIQWWAGIISWVIACVAMLVAAPLWAFAHAFAEGEGFAGERARLGYLMLARAAATPALMVAGLLLAMLLTAPVAQLLGEYVSGFAAGLTGGRLGVFSALFFLALVVLLVIGLITRIFSLVVILPNTVFNALGHAVSAMGGDDAQHHARRDGAVVVAGVRTVAGARPKLPRLPRFKNSDLA